MHHTKDKGDQGLGFVVAALLRYGVQVALPISEHLPFDCIAISQDGRLCRLSVKYRAAKKGTVEIRFRSSWADRHGVHVKAHNMHAYDATAVYCPQTESCYFIRNDEIIKGSVSLRIEEASKAWKHIRSASDFSNPTRIF